MRNRGDDVKEMVRVLYNHRHRLHRQECRGLVASAVELLGRINNIKNPGFACDLILNLFPDCHCSNIGEEITCPVGRSFRNGDECLIGEIERDRVLEAVRKALGIGALRQLTFWPELEA